MSWLLFAAAARADQCAWIDPETANAARRFLPPGAVWAELCEPCGERTPRSGVVGESRVAPTSSPGHVEVTIDGRSVDLAYVYVRATPEATVLTNLARLVRCPATGVSATLPVPAPPPADLPVPSPCAQRTDTDGDGDWDFVQWYVYGANRALTAVITDADADGHPEAVVRLTLDEAGHPVRATLDDEGGVDRVTDCRTERCPTNWIPQCPERTDCARDALGLVTDLRRGASHTVNDYGCWSKVGGAWTWERPADLPPLPAR